VGGATSRYPRPGVRDRFTIDINYL
jgi:hypothetical protein